MKSNWTKRLAMLGLLGALGTGGALAQEARDRNDRAGETLRPQGGGWNDDDDGRWRRGHDDDDDGRGRRGRHGRR